MKIAVLITAASIFMIDYRPHYLLFDIERIIQLPHFEGKVRIVSSLRDVLHKRAFHYAMSNFALGRGGYYTPLWMVNIFTLWDNYRNFEFQSIRWKISNHHGYNITPEQVEYVHGLSEKLHPLRH